MPINGLSNSIFRQGTAGALITCNFSKCTGIFISLLTSDQAQFGKLNRDSLSVGSVGKKANLTGKKATCGLEKGNYVCFRVIE